MNEMLRQWAERFGATDRPEIPDVWVRQTDIYQVSVTTGEVLNSVYTVRIVINKSPVFLGVNFFHLPDEALYQATVTAAICGITSYQSCHETLWGVT